MRVLTWLIALVVLAVWSLLAIGVWALLAGPGDALIAWVSGLFAAPAAQDWAEWGLDLVQDAGKIVVALIWALGMFGILVATVKLRRPFRRR